MVNIVVDFVFKLFIANVELVDKLFKLSKILPVVLFILNADILEQ